MFLIWTRDYSNNLDVPFAIILLLFHVSAATWFGHGDGFVWLKEISLSYDSAFPNMRHNRRKNPSGLFVLDM